MFYPTSHPNDAAVPPSSLPDWEERPESFHGPNHNFSGFEEALGIMSHFDHAANEGLDPVCLSMSCLDLLNGPGRAGYWPYLPIPSPTPPLTDDALATAHLASQAASPASSTTLFDSPDHFFGNVKLPQVENALDTKPIAVSPARLQVALPSQTELMFGVSSYRPSSALVEQTPYDDRVVYHSRQNWPGQQPSQHQVGAAAVIAPDLAKGMEFGTDASALVAFAPLLFPFGSLGFPGPQQVTAVSNQPGWVPNNDNYQPVIQSTAGFNYPVGESYERDAEPPKKKRKQSTVKRYSCPFEGCPTRSARSHNIKIHVNSVHLGLRSHRCEKPGCPRAFSRRHDLLRHQISAHTNLGSPRNANNAKATKSAIAALKNEVSGV